MILPLSIDLAIDLEDLKVFSAFLSIFAVVIALALHAVIERIVTMPAGRDTQGGDDPYFFPIGDAPTLPHQIYPRELER